MTYYSLRDKKETLETNLRTLIPNNFQASIFPISINFQDLEKVVALVKQKTAENGIDFCTQINTKQQFAVGVKIFPFDNRVVSVQIVLIRIEKANTSKADNENQMEGTMTKGGQIVEETDDLASQQTTRDGGSA